MNRRRFLFAGAALVAAACTATKSTRPEDALTAIYADPDKNEWPEELLRLPAETQATYRYAVANHDTLQYIPCFCGCVNAGHSSNFDCYVSEVLPDGRLRLDTMSFG
jgi:hypothetical protein